MTEVQAAEVIRIVLADQRLNVLNEVREVIGEQRVATVGVRREGEDIAADSAIGALDVLDAKLNTLMQRGG